MALLGGSLRDLNDVRALDVAVVDADGNQITDFTTTVQFPDPPTVSTVAAVSVGPISTALLVADPNRRVFMIVNDGSNKVFVSFGAVASTTTFTMIIPKNGVYEGSVGGYAGAVSAIRATGTGDVMVTDVSIA